jgi:exopolysaccharide biosynthesis polyprenyl glycosylphosphotransferase
MPLDSFNPPPVAERQSASTLPQHCRGRAQYVSDVVQGISLLGDALAAFSGLAVAARFSPTEPFSAWGSATLSLPEYATRLAVTTLALVAVLANRHVYDRHLHVAHRESVMKAIGVSILIWGGGLLGLSALFQSVSSLSSGYVLRALPIVFIFLLGWRTVLHSVISRPQIAQYLRRRVLFLGWTQEAARVVEFLGNDPTHPYEIAGYLHATDTPIPTPLPASLRLLGQLSPTAENCSLDRLIRQERIDNLVLADPDVPTSRIAALSRLCENELAELTVIPSYFLLFRSGLRMSTVNGVPMVSGSRLPLDSVINRTLKRATDILGSIVGLILFAPVVIAFELLVYSESPGPILYRQRRLGLKGRVFNLIKIRSMRMDAEGDGRVGWTTKGDPRCLKIGSVMRRFNIDEIPQFWNVLMGQMSLVGPRPERPELTVHFNETIEDYNVRHGVKPGMTGLAQIQGLRGDTDLSARIRQDLNYIEHWSLWTDFRIMFLTFLKRKNAF